MQHTSLYPTTTTTKENRPVCELRQDALFKSPQGFRKQGNYPQDCSSASLWGGCDSASKLGENVGENAPRCFLTAQKEPLKSSNIPNVFNSSQGSSLISPGKVTFRFQEKPIFGL